MGCMVLLYKIEITSKIAIADAEWQPPRTVCHYVKQKQTTKDTRKKEKYIKGAEYRLFPELQLSCFVIV